MEGWELARDFIGDELFRKVVELARRKWGIFIAPHDLLQVHKVGQSRVIMLMNDLKHGSAYAKLLNEKKEDFLPG